MATSCHIALGSNQISSTGRPIDTLLLALRLIDSESLKIVQVSQWYRTPAFPTGSGPDYVNAVAKLESTLPAEECLARLHTIENDLGRTRHQRWEPRVCDIDLLNFGDRILPDRLTYDYWRDLSPQAQSEQAPDQLILPHPRLQDRAFVLIPMRDISPDWKHPVSGASVVEMIAALPAEDIEQIQVISP